MSLWPDNLSAACREAKLTLSVPLAVIRDRSRHYLEPWFSVWKCWFPTSNLRAWHLLGLHSIAPSWNQLGYFWESSTSISRKCDTTSPSRTAGASSAQLTDSFIMGLSYLGAPVRNTRYYLNMSFWPPRSISASCDLQPTEFLLYSCSRII